MDYDVGRAKSASGGTLTGTSLAYDAATDSFTLKAGSEEFVFTPAALIIPASNYYRYEKIEGDRTTELNLDWGMRSEWTTAPDYVALGQMISRQRDVPTGIDSYHSIDFAFGLPSPASAVPKTGSAAYALSFVGTRSSAVTEYLLQISGAGTALVDFGTARLEISGGTSSYNFRGPGILGIESEGKVNASGAIVAGENRFTGTFTAKAGASDTYTGNFAGSFYGPNSDDIGGTLYGASGTQFYSLAFAGYGLQDTSPDDTLANLTGSTRFRTVGTSIDLPAAVFQNPPLSETIIFNADTQTYTVSSRSHYGFQFSFGSANRTAGDDSGDMLAFGAAHAIVDGKTQYKIGLFDGSSDGVQLTYASFMRVFATQTDLDDQVTGESVEYIGFGNFTPPHQMPRTGSATYTGRLFGDIHDGSKLLASLIGRSDLTANFGTGALDASLYPARIDPNGSSTALGRYDFRGLIDGYSAAFTGSLNAGTGNLAGRFYGNAAQEYVAVFNIDDPAAGKMAGVSLGAR